MTLRHHRSPQHRDTKSLKAGDLTKNEIVFKRLRKKAYLTQYEKCVHLIESINKHNLRYTTYTVPVIVPSQPHYDVDECTIYLKEELLKADFYVRLMKPGNVLYISWKSEDVAKVRKMKEKKENRTNSNSSSDVSKFQEIDYNPDSALSNVHLTTTLMMENPKYAHLKSLQNLRQSRRK
jgi:hypothetical protein